MKLQEFDGMKFQFDYVVGFQCPYYFQVGVIKNFDDDLAKQIALSGIAENIDEINEKYGLKLNPDMDVSDLNLRIIDDGFVRGLLNDGNHEMLNTMQLDINGVKIELICNASPRNSDGELLAKCDYVEIYHANSSLRMRLQDES